jgi:hypothetical protein
MNDYLSFRRFITPAFIQVFFWLGVVAVVLTALASMFRGDAAGLFGGLAMLVFGVVFVRIYCELLILLFRIYDELVAIRGGNATLDPSRGFAVVPPEAGSMR